MRGDKPHLAAVPDSAARVPGQRKPKGLTVPTGMPSEPRWWELFEYEAHKPPDVVVRARRVWRRIVPQVKQTGRLAYIDADLLTDYCICVARIQQCEKEIGDSLVVSGHRGVSGKNALITVANSYRSRVKLCEEQLGIGSMNRMRLPPPPAAPASNDDLDEDTD